MLDTRLALQTPEGVEIELEPAGLMVRANAYMFDLFIKIALIAAISVVAGLLGGLGMGLLLISWFLLDWFFAIFFEVFHNGQTPGKKIMGIKVVHDNATAIRFGSSFIRNLLRFIDFLPAFWGAGIVAMVLNRRFKRLGDYAAGTMVVYVEKLMPSQVISDQIAFFPTPLSMAEKQSLIEYAERGILLSMQRRIELAEILAPISQYHGENAVGYLHAVAKGIVSDETK